MSQRTNEADIAAVTEVVRAYYDGMMAGDEAKLARAFHPRACIVGNEGASCTGRPSRSSWPSARGQPHRRGPTNGGSTALSFEGDTALVRLGGQFAGVWYSDDLSMLRIDDAWRIVHKTFYAHPAG